jgi:hypothetical protein
MKLSFSQPFNVNQVVFRIRKRNFRMAMGGSDFLQQMSNMEISKEITIDKNQYLKNKEEILNKKTERELEQNLSNPLLLPKPWWDNGDNNLTVLVPQPKNDEKLVVKSRGSAIKYDNRYDANTAMSSNIEQTKTLRNIRDRMDAEASAKNKMRQKVSKYFK